ncbi:MAG: DUF4406 domain-containing protein [Bacteroidaceae bacterium]|nr:DUF4406 domain-containing protein [Bacteroidaceae bacterium]
MKTIYISGPITDPATGKPRGGWQKDFLNAEAKLRSMGFRVLNPVDIAQEVEDVFKWPFNPPTRVDYIMACLWRMHMAHDEDRLHGVYVIGTIDECLASCGVRMELLLANLLLVPIYAESRGNYRVDALLTAQLGTENIEELLKE